MSDLHENRNRPHSVSARASFRPVKKFGTPFVDGSAESRRRQRSIWVAGTLTAAAVIAFIGSTFAGTAIRGTIKTSVQNPGGPVDKSTATVVRVGDGSFINYIRSTENASDAERSWAKRSVDGTNWEPVEITGLPPGNLVQVMQSDGQLVGRVSNDLASPSSLVVSSDGINWTQIATPESGRVDGYLNHVAPEDAARLADGRYLVAGTQYSEIDFPSLGIDHDDICGYGESNLELQLCDGTSQPLDRAMPAPGSNILWTVEADGTNPTPVSNPSGLEPRFNGLTSAGGAAIVDLINPEHSEGNTVAKTHDAVNWDIQTLPPSGAVTGPETSYSDTTYRTVEDGTGAHIERSDDGANTWHRAAPLGAYDSVRVVAAGPAGVVAVAYVDPDLSVPSFDSGAGAFYEAVNSGSAAAVEQASSPFTVVQDSYTLKGSVPVGQWSVTDAGGDVVVTFASPILAGDWGLDYPSNADDETVRSVDPLTNDVTILDNGEPLVTFRYADIVAAAGEMVQGFASLSQGTISFSADQGTTWQELSPINGQVLSVAVGDDEVLLTTGTSMATPLRLELPVN